MLHIIGGCGDEQFGCDEPTSPGPENNGVVGIDPAEIGLEVGESGSVTARTLLPGVPAIVQWRSRDPAIATVDGGALAGDSAERRQ